MKIKILQGVEGAKNATGLAVIIDVFRAFTVEAYLMQNGAQKLLPVGDMKIAYEYQKDHRNCILIGERNGIMLPGFDYGNSPSQIQNIDFSGKTILHTTSTGTQGIASAKNADEIVTGSLVNSKAIATYIKTKKIEEVSLVCMDTRLREGEDYVCAMYIKSLLENNHDFQITDKIETLKNTSGAKFFITANQEVFPKEDFYLCTEINKFDFVLKVVKNEDESNVIEKIDIE